MRILTLLPRGMLSYPQVVRFLQKHLMKALIKVSTAWTQILVRIWVVPTLVFILEVQEILSK